MSEKVVITGAGCICPIGNSFEEVVENSKNGKNGIGKNGLFNTDSYNFHKVGQVEIEAIPKYQKHYGRSERMLLYSALQAIENAGINLQEYDANSVSIVTGTTLGGITSAENYYREYLNNNRASDLAKLPFSTQHSPNDVVMCELGISGQSMVLSTACSASTHAIGIGADLIRDGVSDIVMVGGYDPLSEITYSGFGILRSISDEEIRPFDKKRKGLILGEGAGVLLLERYDNAVKRNAKILAEVVGYGASSDASHPTAPHKDGEGASNAIFMALNNAGISPDKIDYINAHGTGTRANDLAETKAIKNVFKENACNINISSTKSMTGHLLGGAGAIEAIITIGAMRDSFIPPTINYENADPECDLNYTENKSVEKEINYALSNSFGFGGNNAVVILKKMNN